MKKPAQAAGRTWVPVVTLGPLLAVVIAVAFTQSFGALTQIGEVNAWRPAWLLPVLVDVGMLGTNISSAIFRARDLPGSWLANGMFVLFALVSIWANISHAITTSDFAHTTPLQAGLFAAIAPLAQLGLTHMLMWMFPNEKDRAKLATSRATRAAKRARKASKLGLDPTPVIPSNDDRAVPPEIPSLPRPAVALAPAHDAQGSVRAHATASVGADREEARKQVLDYWRKHGRRPTGELVGEWMGRSKKTGQRLVKDLELEGAFDHPTAESSSWEQPLPPVSEAAFPEMSRA